MTSRFDFLDTPIQGLGLIQRKPFADDRGYLERLFCTEELKSLVQDKNILQINHTLTHKRGAVRGMHFQHSPHCETKLICCISGEVFDVAVDLRRGSSTFLLWHAEILSANNHRTFIIPEGFAHGFQTLTEDCEMLYLHTAAYRAEAEGGLNAMDPRLGIQWPLAVTEQSVRDSAHPPISDDFPGIAP